MPVLLKHDASTARTKDSNNKRCNGQKLHILLPSACGSRVSSVEHKWQNFLLFLKYNNSGSEREKALHMQR